MRPQTFTEWLQRRKVFDRDPRLTLRADEVLVKELVAATIGAEHVIPTLWRGPRLPPRDERTWPRPLALKASHASGWNHFVRDEREHDWDAIERRVASWMAQTCGVYTGEWHYRQIVPQLLVEPVVTHVTDLPIDYKFWVFRGKVRCVQVDLDREHGHKGVMFDAHWRRFDLNHGYPTDVRDIDAPASLPRLFAFAECLAEDISFVRVDFYEVAGRPLFGEMTFFPEAGYKAFEPGSFDRTFRRWLDA